MTSSAAAFLRSGALIRAFDLEKLKTMPPDEIKDATESGPLLERHLPIKGNELDSRDIFVSGREIIVRHGTDKYRLRLTAQNKLILTK